MKQTKKLTRNQRDYLNKVLDVDTTNLRLVRETKDFIEVKDMVSGKVISYTK